MQWTGTSNLRYLLYMSVFLGKIKLFYNKPSAYSLEIEIFENSLTKTSEKLKY